MEPLSLEVTGLSHRWPGAERDTPGPLDFRLEPGARGLLLGPNGAGKSTLFQRLVGLLDGPGSVRVGGVLLEKRSRREIRRRVGLLSHRAAIAADGRETAEILHEAVNLVALFGPEHGFQGRALAGEATPSFEHPEWRIPVHSLYGATREPSPEMLAGVDCVVCDLQDLGVFPSPTEAPDFYVDYGETGPFVAEVGDSECAV